jgi:hypothetical protein
MVIFMKFNSNTTGDTGGVGTDYPFEDTKGQTIQWPRENRPKDKQ